MLSRLLLAVLLLCSSTQSYDRPRYMVILTDGHWSSYTNLRVSEDTPLKQRLALIETKDTSGHSTWGLNGDVTCSVVDDSGHIHFALERTGGYSFNLVATSVLDREQRGEYIVFVVCSDSGMEHYYQDDIPPLRSYTKLVITIVDRHGDILDKNDYDPVFQLSRYAVSVADQTAPGVKLMEVFATDMDKGDSGKVTYSLEDADDLVTVNFWGYIYVNADLNRDELESFSFTAVATDRGQPPRSSRVPVTVTVVDHVMHNEHRPRFVTEPYFFEADVDVAPGDVIGTVSATDDDDPPYDSFTFVISPPDECFAIDGKTGVISSKVELGLPVYHFRVMAVDDHKSSLETTDEVFILVTAEN